MPSMQVPPFLQGDEAQSLMSAGREGRHVYSLHLIVCHSLFKNQHMQRISNVYPQKCFIFKCLLSFLLQLMISDSIRF